MPAAGVDISEIFLIVGLTDWPEDLHFHDLRREFACRLMESSADLHDVRDFLGHANITTTSRYVRSTPVRLAQALERMEASAVTVADADDQPHRAEVRRQHIEPSPSQR